MSQCECCAAPIKDTDRICVYCGQENPNFKENICLNLSTNWNSDEIRKIVAYTKIPAHYIRNKSKEEVKILVRQELAYKLAEEIAKRINIYKSDDIITLDTTYRTAINIECL